MQALKSEDLQQLRSRYMIFAGVFKLKIPYYFVGVIMATLAGIIAGISKWDAYVRKCYLNGKVSLLSALFPTTTDYRLPICLWNKKYFYTACSVSGLD